MTYSGLYNYLTVIKLRLAGNFVRVILSQFFFFKRQQNPTEKLRKNDKERNFFKIVYSSLFVRCSETNDHRNLELYNRETLFDSLKN